MRVGKTTPTVSCQLTPPLEGERSADTRTDGVGIEHLWIDIDCFRGLLKLSFHTESALDVVH